MNILIPILTIILIIILLILGGYLLKYRGKNFFGATTAKNQTASKLLGWSGYLLLILAAVTLFALLSLQMFFLVTMLVIDAIFVVLMPFIVLTFFPKSN